jgi:hypothetical protein
MNIKQVSTAASEIKTVEYANKVIAAITVAINKDLVKLEKLNAAQEKANFDKKTATPAECKAASILYNKIEKLCKNLSKLIITRTRVTDTRDYLAQ